jgi:hypothetical protein
MVSGRVTVFWPMSGWRPVAAVVENRSLVAADDGFEPARTADAVQELRDKDNVFGIIGTPTAMVSLRYASAGQRFQPRPFRSIGIRSAMCDVRYFIGPHPDQVRRRITKGAPEFSNTASLAAAALGNFVDGPAGSTCDARLPRFATSSSDPAKVFIGPGSGLLQARIVDHVALLLMMEWE